VIEFKRGLSVGLLELARLLFRDRFFEIPDSYRLFDSPPDGADPPVSS
jgi:hypothetical protein